MEIPLPSGREPVASVNEPVSAPPVATRRDFYWPAPVTVLLVALALPATFWSWTNPDDAFAALYSSGGQPWLGQNLHALFTSALLHADFPHLVFNLWWLVVLGSFLESCIGSVRYSLIVLTSALLGSVAQLAIGGDLGIGLSGVVYALFGVLLAWRRREPVIAAILTTPRIVVFIAWFFLCIALTHVGMMNVANSAHAAGLFAGLWFGASRFPALRALRIATGVLVLGASVTVFFWAPWLENWHFAQLHRLSERDTADTYHEAAREFTRRFPDNEWALQYDAWDAHTRRDYARAARVMEKQLARSKDKLILNNLAWLRATCPDPALRNGPEAVRLAEEACALSGWSESNLINTLAAAYAEVGRYEDAVATNRKAVAVAADKASLAPYTEAFEAGRPWRDEPAPAPAASR